MRGVRALALRACAIALLASSAVRALGTPETFAPDPRTLGMAHADAADDEGAALAHTNPGAVSRARTPRLFAAWSLSLPALTVELEREPTDPKLAPASPAPVPGLAFGFALPMEIGPPDLLAFGVSAYFPTQVLIRARAHDPARPFFYRYDSQTEHYDVSVSLALNIVEWLSIGGGARLAAGQGGSLTLGADVLRGRLTRQAVDAQQTALFSPMFGVLAGPVGLSGLVEGSAGFVWREPTQFEIALPATLTLDGAGAGALVDVLIQSNYQPRTAVLGLGVDVLDALRVHVDLAYLFWSAAPPPHLQSRLDLSGEALDDLGIGETLDAPAPGEERVVSPGFTDTLAFRVGAEGRVLADVLRVRAGYQLRPTPVPDQTSGTNIVDARAHIVALGLGVRVPLPLIADEPIGFDLGYQAQILEPRGAQKDSGNDPVGNWRASGVVHALATGVSCTF